MTTANDKREKEMSQSKSKIEEGVSLFPLRTNPFRLACKTPSANFLDPIIAPSVK